MITEVLLRTVALALMGNVVIYLGLAFGNGILLPTQLGGFYATTSVLTRMVIMLPFFALPANLLFGYCFRSASPGMATASIMAATAVVMCANAMLLAGGIGVRPLVAGVVLVLAAVWFGVELGAVGSTS